MTMVIYCLFCEPGKGEYVCRAATALFDCRAIYFIKPTACRRLVCRID